ncbi:MAG: hypothetical protein JEY71_07685 [Sphaerochaeta sp.]|nr:hypothetical protein [Sphaerochaeta sp.]
MEQTLHLYKNNNVWLFDEKDKNIFSEPFVEGSSELITEIQRKARLSGDSLSITFSNEPFPEAHQELLWQASREGGTWNQYYSKEFDMSGWLCPVLLVYFERAPRTLYVRVAKY